MIALVLAMLRARRAQAATLLLLAALATAAATAGPAYLRATDAASAASAVAGATPAERTVAAVVDESLARFQFGRDQDTFATSLLDLPGFTRIYSAQVMVLGVEHREGDFSWLTSRENVCGHLTVTAGRCAALPGEVVLGAQTAGRLGVRPGHSFTVTYAQFDEQSRTFKPLGTPSPVTVVGIYRPIDPGELYWGRSPYFRPGPLDPLQEPVFTPRTTIDALDHLVETRTLEAVAGPGALAADRLDAVRSQVMGEQRAVNQALRDDNGHGAGFDGLLALLDRIAAGQGLAREVVPVAAAPMVALCWFVIFLAVGYATAGRREELALVALRGARLPERWWLTTGEALVAVLLGAPIGFFLGHLGVYLVAAVRMDTTAGAGVSVAALPWAAVAVLGALAAVVLAQIRAVGTPVVELLRRVPARGGWWRALAGEALVAVLAVVAVVQLRGPAGRLTGVALLTPALAAAVVAMAGGRLLRPVAAGLGRRAAGPVRSGCSCCSRSRWRRSGSRPPRSTWPAGRGPSGRSPRPGRTGC